jgi:hypothetical protein
VLFLLIIKGFHEGRVCDFMGNFMWFFTIAEIDMGSDNKSNYPVGLR